MADVRAMLRVSREARRINHPNASYTSDGKLMCTLCETMIKSEGSWQAHLHSSSHTLRSTRVKEAVTARPEGASNRKRKASMLESPSVGDRKKSKPAVENKPGRPQESDEDNVSTLTETEPSDNARQTPTTEVAKDQVSNADDEAADPAALDALERELAGLEADHRRETAAQNGITISAAPMTAEQIAAQAREEQSTQRGRRDVELEAEKEDAARLLEDEFDEMEGLEERVRKLREQREALRKKPAGADQGKKQEISRSPLASSDHDPVDGNNEGDSDEDGEEEDDDEEDDIDEWQFGAR